MNWYVHGRTQQIVGAEPDEGGRCGHLKDGDVAFGYSGEADSFGEERYLKCQPCYEAFLQVRKTEPTECDDCGQEFPRNTLYRYVPYIMDGSPSENEDSKRWVCKDCQTKDRHIQRLENDAFLRQQDDDEEDFLIPDEDWDDCEPDPEDPTDHQCTGRWCKGCEEIFGQGYWDEIVFHRKTIGITCHAGRYSKCINKIVVGARTNG